eukprot:evm.model.NODE_6679_length_19313_cov_19.735516.7
MGKLLFLASFLSFFLMPPAHSLTFHTICYKSYTRRLLRDESADVANGDDRSTNVAERTTESKRSG